MAGDAQQENSVVMSADKLCLFAEEAVDKTVIIAARSWDSLWEAHELLNRCFRMHRLPHSYEIPSPTATQLDAQVNVLHACLYRWGVHISSAIRSVCFVSVVFRIVLSSSCW